MFLNNLWYCAGWDYEVTQGSDSLVQRKIAGTRVVLYRKLNGAVVALEDRCPHRQAALSLGRKEGDSLRCMYHGMRFGPDGRCLEVPGQSSIPSAACVRAFPVVEKDNWIWVWMGHPSMADPEQICFSIGPGNPEWRVKTSKTRVKADYRLEIANLADLSHLAWVHEKTVGGSRKYSEIRPVYRDLPKGINTSFWTYSVPATAAMAHLFPEGTLFDLSFDITHTLPCNWVMNLRIFTAGTADSGPSNGTLVLDTWTCQAVTPRDADSVDYYYSWGPRADQDIPGLSDMMREALDAAFTEDRRVLEHQHRRVRENPDYSGISIAVDAGPLRMLRLLNRLLDEQRCEHAAIAA
ncbi:MAG: Rieske 2Fe-2S domain-containing protein [Panacagrimonas sp.]